MLVGLESGSLGSLSTTTASGQLLPGAGNVGAINMLPQEGTQLHCCLTQSPRVQPAQQLLLP